MLVSEAPASPLHAPAKSFARILRGLPAAWRVAGGMAVSVPFTVLQEFIGPDIPGHPFLVLLPGVLMSSVLLRWQGGLATLMFLSAYADYWHLDGPGFGIDRPETFLGLFLFVAFGVYVVGIVHSMHLALERQEALVEEQRAMMADLSRARDEWAAAERAKDVVVREMNHRVKNVIASVASVVRQTMRHSPDMEEFGRSFDDRIKALTRTQDLVALGGYAAGAALSDVLAGELEPFRGRGATDASGPAVQLGAKTAEALGLALHELMTNAAKYGGLSAIGTGLAVKWALDGETLAIDWVESTRTPPAPPVRKGFGTRLLDGTVRSRGGTVTRTESPEGYRFDIRLPMAALAE